MTDENQKMVAAMMAEMVVALIESTSQPKGLVVGVFISFPAPTGGSMFVSNVDPKEAAVAAQSVVDRMDGMGHIIKGDFVDDRSIN